MVADGHRLAVVSVRDGKGWRYLLVRNMTTRTTYSNRKVLPRAVRGLWLTPLYLLGAAGLFAIAWVLSFQSAVALGVTAAGALLVIGHLVKRYNQSRFALATRHIVAETEAA
jgi:hypothetical protein